MPILDIQFHLYKISNKFHPNYNCHFFAGETSNFSGTSNSLLIVSNHSKYHGINSLYKKGLIRPRMSTKRGKSPGQVKVG